MDPNPHRMSGGVLPRRGFSTTGVLSRAAYCFVALCAFAVLSPVAKGGIALVQHTSVDANTVTKASLAFKSNNTAGNWIAVCVRGGLSSSQVFTISDSNSNIYQRGAQIGFTGSAVSLAIFYAENIKGGANTVTVSDTVLGPMRFAILEYSGVALMNSLDGPGAVATGSGTTPNSGNLTTTANGDLLLGAIATANPATFTAGSGYKAEEFVGTQGVKLIAEDQIQLSAGVASAGAAIAASDVWGAALVAVKAAGSGVAAPSISSLSPTSGPAGTGVTITGTGFGSIQGTVTFNGVAASPAMWNPTSILVSVPVGASSGNVIVTAGGVPSNGVNFTVTLTPVISSVSPTSGGVGATVVISGAGFGSPQGSSTVSFAGTAATPTSWNLTTIRVQVPSGATSGNVVVTVGGLTSNGVSFTVIPISVSLAPVNPTVATNTSVGFTATVQGDALSQGVSWSLTGTGCSGNTCGKLASPSSPYTIGYVAPPLAPNPPTVTLTATSVADPTKAAASLITVTQSALSIMATAGTPQSATVNSPFATALQATVKDSGNNPISGLSVTFAAPTSGASGTFAGGVNTATTNALGVATSATFTANATAGGPYNVTASAPSVATPANFSLTNLANTAGSITATAGTPQSAPINTAFAMQLQATVKDVSNNPVNGAIVTFAAPASGASGTFAGGVNTATTLANGVATAPVFTANGTAGGPYNLTASVPGVATPAIFSLTNIASAPANIALVQHTSVDAHTVTSASLAFPSTNTSGNWIAVVVRAGLSSSQVFTISDSNNNTYLQALQLGFSPTATTMAIFYAENIKGGANTITVKDTVSGPLRFAILEYSGVALSNSLDATAAKTAVGTAPNSGTLTTSANGDLLLAGVGTSNPATFTAGSGYTVEEFVGVQPGKLIAEDQIQTNAGVVSAGATVAASDNWGAVLAAFRAANGVVLPISVSVTPATASVQTGSGTQGFTATLANDTSHKGATWSLSGAGCTASACGTLTNVTTTSVTYNGPASVPNPATVTLSATSIADNTKSGIATITVTQGVLSVAVSPKRAAVTMSASQTVQITATVSNDPQNLGVTWQVDGSNGGNASTGTVSATGLFTPGTLPGQHTVTAVSNANASVSASTLVAVTDLRGVYLHHNDAQRTGQNLKEYGLTPALVNSATFGQLFSCSVDGFVYAQPLWVANLTIGGTTRNVVFVATEHNSVYAFDADSPSCVQLWKVNFLGTGISTIVPNDIAGKTDIIPEVGITSTPVIDPATNTLYVLPKTKETVGTVSGQTCTTNSPCFVHRLHALDLITGAEKFGGPMVVSAANFSAHWHLQRPALLLANNTIYLAFGSHGDWCPYYGWVMGYNASTLAQVFVKALTNPAQGCSLSGDLGAGGIWQSGAGPAADASGNVYVTTGNGGYDGTSNWGDSVVKLGPTGSVVDWFTPFNEEVFRANDVDLGSGGVVIFPSSVGSTAHPNLALATGKPGILYLLDQNNLGKFNSGSNNDVQEVIPVPPANTTNGSGGIFGEPAYFNGNIYATGVGYKLSQFPIANGAIGAQSASSNNKLPYPAGTPAVSAGGATNGVVWILDLGAWQTNGVAILNAYDANNVSTLLYSSPTSGAGAAGPAVKFTVPTVANGKVYIGGQYTVVVFGLRPN